MTTLNHSLYVDGNTVFFSSENGEAFNIRLLEENSSSNYSQARALESVEETEFYYSVCQEYLDKLQSS